MGSAGTWNALTALLACTDVREAASTWELLCLEGLVATDVRARSIVLQQISELRDEEVGTGSSRAQALARRILATEVVSVRAHRADPEADRAARSSLAFDGGSRDRACARCGAWSEAWWREGRCPCGAERNVPVATDTCVECPACASLEPLASVYCEACGARIRAEPEASETVLLIELAMRGEPPRLVVAPSEARVGRSEQNEVHVPLLFVGSFHARLGVENGRVWIEDAGSPSGTYVGGKALRARTWLADRDEARIGPLVLRARATTRREARLEIATRTPPAEPPAGADAGAIARALREIATLLDDACELPSGGIWATPLLGRTESLLRTFDLATARARTGGAGAHVRARVLRSIERLRSGARALLGTTMATMDGWKRLDALEHALRALAPNPPLSSVAALHIRLIDELERVVDDYVRACLAWESTGYEVYEANKGNRNWARALVRKLRALPLESFPSGEMYLAMVANVVWETRGDPYYPDPVAARERVRGILRRLRAS